MIDEEYFRRNWFKLSPPKDMDEIRSGLKEAEDVLNEFSKSWSEEIPADNMMEMFAKDVYYRHMMKALRAMGFKWECIEEGEKNGQETC